MGGQDKNQRTEQIDDWFDEMLDEMGYPADDEPLEVRQQKINAILETGAEKVPIHNFVIKLMEAQGMEPYSGTH